MKTIKTLASLLLFAGVLASCQKEVVVEPAATTAPTTFTAALESQTKVTIDGFTPKFEVGDVLNVTANNNASASFKVTEVSESGLATLKIDGSWSSEPQAPYFIYNGTPSMVAAPANMLGFNAPNNVLDAKAGSISLATLVAKASSLDNVTLLNASCLLKIVVPDSVRGIKVTPASGMITAMAGINLTSAINITAMSTTPLAEIYYSGHNGLGLVAGTYYIPMFPQTFNGGVKVGYTTDGEEYVWREKAGNFIFQRNKIYDMGSLADWVTATPKFTIGDIIGEYTGGVTMGPYSAGRVTGNEANVNFVVAESDDASKGNVMFTTFAGASAKIYAQFDLVSGEVNIPVGSVFNSSYGAVPFTNALTLVLSEDATTLSLAEAAEVGVFPLSPALGYGFLPFSVVKKAPVAPITVADFVGTFKGQYNGDFYPAHNGVSNVADVEFVFEETDQNGCNVKLVSVGGYASGALGTLDIETGVLEFAAGQQIPYPENYVVTAAKPLGDALKLQYSEDRNSITLVNSPCLINSMAYPSFCPEILAISLNRYDSGASEGFAITDLTGHDFAVECKINGESYTGTMKSQATAAPGANVYVSGIFGAANGFNSEAYVTFDIETGTLTFSTSSATNNVKLPFSLSQYVTKEEVVKNVLVLSADKKTITIKNEQNALVFWDGDSSATVHEFKATRVD